MEKMSIDRAYIEAAIETLDLVHQIANYLQSEQKTGEMNNFLSQIQTKADAKISSSLGQRLGISIRVDQEGKTTKYWEGVRDTAKLSMKQWQGLKEIPRYLSFLAGTRSNLAAKIGLVEVSVNPLEAFIGEEPVQEVVESVNPLEEMLSSPQPPTPEPIPTPVVQPAPIVPKAPEPEPPAPEPSIPTPSLESLQPSPTVTPEPLPQPSDKLSALDEALKSSGLESSVPTEPSPTLSDMLLSKDETGEKTEEEDDMLSLSLREALKILRDEDED
jgi:hypothetical protein